MGRVVTPTPDTAALTAARKLRVPDSLWERLNPDQQEDLLSGLREHLVAAYAADAGLRALVEENAKLRWLLWRRHGCDGLYGDDGEQQCGKCLIDFKRMPAATIEEIWRIRGLRALAATTPPEETS